MKSLIFLRRLFAPIIGKWTCLIRWCTLHLAANSYHGKWIDDKDNIKVEIATVVVVVVIVVVVVVVVHIKKCHFLRPQNIRVYEALARFARSRIYYLKYFFFQMRSSVQFFFCNTPTNPTTVLKIYWPQITRQKYTLEIRGRGGGGGGGGGALLRTPHIPKIHLLLNIASIKKKRFHGIGGPHILVCPGAPTGLNPALCVCVCVCVWVKLSSLLGFYAGDMRARTWSFATPPPPQMKILDPPLGIIINQKI